jgi:GGDEF domain-containing protein
MTVAASAAALAPAQNRLSVPQMLHVMRIEFHRARGQRYPVVSLMIAVDGADDIQERWGWQAKQNVMRVTYQHLRKVTSEHAFFGMALMSGDRIMAVFPNTAPARAGELGRLLTEGARGLEVPDGSERL